MKENKDMSISLILENAKIEYATEINKVTEKYNLPPYFVWMIFNDFLNEMEKNKNRQLEMEMQPQPEMEEEKEVE